MVPKYILKVQCHFSILKREPCIWHFKIRCPKNVEAFIFFYSLERVFQLSLHNVYISLWLLSTCDINILHSCRGALCNDEAKLRPVFICSSSKHSQVSTYMDLIGTFLQCPLGARLTNTHLQGRTPAL